MPVVGKLVFADIGDQRVRIDEVAVLFLDAVLDCGLSQDLYHFGIHGQPGQLLADVGLLFYTIIVCHEGCRTGNELQLHSLVCFGAEAVKIGEHDCRVPGKFPFPFQEDSVIGDEDILEHNKGVINKHAAGDRVVEEAVPFGHLRLGGNHGDPFCIHGGCEGNCICPVILFHGMTGGNQHFVATGHLADVGLCAAHNNAVASLLHDAYVKVLMLYLLRGTKASVPFHVGKAHCEGKVILLEVLSIGLDICRVIGAVLLVDPSAHHGHCIESVLGDEFCSRRFSKRGAGPQFYDFAQPQKVIPRSLRLQRESHSVTVLIYIRQKILVAGVVTHDVIHSNPIIRDFQNGVPGDVVYPLPVTVNNPAVLETFHILLR
ncbi:MAG: hypothetical protein A4E57_04504 [Syntrophorhabdaceae bacterium PtaU1.Bin034]|nr:MAG: hypothetical protein A4E57_04504 [Syntrophorhabdaceae bacterium PtaU1.Bin034]